MVQIVEAHPHHIISHRNHTRKTEHKGYVKSVTPFCYLPTETKINCQYKNGLAWAFWYTMASSTVFHCSLIYRIIVIDVVVVEG